MQPAIDPLADVGRGRFVSADLTARLLAAAAATALLLGACSGGSSPSAAASVDASPTASESAIAESAPPAEPAGGPALCADTFPLTLTDDEGGQVTLAAAPTKIVSLTPATTETLFALGAGPAVAATTDYDDYPAEATALPHVASYTGVDVEKIVALAPDVVIAGGNGFTPAEAVTKLRGLGIPVLVVYANDVPGVLRDIELTGCAAGKGTAAHEMTVAMAQGIAAISAASSMLPHPRTFYEIDATKEIYGPADDSFVASMVALAGGEPITTGSATVYSIPLEKLVAADPEVIVLGDANYGTTVADVLARPGWKSMTAVKTSAIRPVNDTLVTRPGPRLVEGLRLLALAIHPDATLPPAPSFPAVP